MDSHAKETQSQDTKMLNTSTASQVIKPFLIVSLTLRDIKLSACDPVT